VRRSAYLAWRLALLLAAVASVAYMLPACATGALPAVDGVTIAGASPRYVQVGETRTLSAVVAARGGADEAVVWLSSDEDRAIVGVDGAVLGVAPGEVVVMAVSAFDATKFASAVLEVTPTATVTAATEGTYLTVVEMRIGAPDATGLGTRAIGLDLGWDESWRGPDRPSWVDADNNWDAVWLFAKFRVGDGPWRHVTLAPAGHAASAGVVVEVPADGKGAFVHRAAVGYGAFSADGLRLVWTYEADGVGPADALDVRLFGVEMVFVPAGAFSLGTGGSEACGFRAGASPDPFLVAGPGPIALGDDAGGVSWATDGCNGGLPEGVTGPAHPTGFAAFYLMKHELSQGLYAGFLNALTQPQADLNRPNEELGAYRFGLTGSEVGAYASVRPHVAMTRLSWASAAAFADWSGLRPMSELEFEKAARGPLEPVPNAFAWGTTTAIPATGLVDADTAHEAPTPEEANANIAFGVGAPLRVGAFAAPAREREAAGAGHYGALDLSGNMHEYAVSVGTAEGRAFTGAHGDGSLDASGHADAADWPDAGGAGAGLRGGAFTSPDSAARVSDRFVAAVIVSPPHPFFGARFARTAP